MYKNKIENKLCTEKKRILQKLYRNTHKTDIYMCYYITFEKIVRLVVKNGSNGFVRNDGVTIKSDYWS